MLMYLKEDEIQRNELLKMLEIDEDDLKNDVAIVRDWMKHQKHLPQEDMEDDLLVERFLLNNKFRIEQTKTKLDNYYTMIRINNVLFQNLWELDPTNISMFKIPLRQLTEDRKRILIIAMMPGNKETSFLEILRAQILVSEMLLRYNYCSTQIVIIDMKGFSSHIFKEFNLNLMIKLIKVLKTCYSGRVDTIHIINSSSWVSLLILRIKNLYGDKVKVHKNMESLYQWIPQKSLPRDYGGEDKSFTEYLEIWKGIVKEHAQLLRKIPEKMPDETLRIGKSILDLEIFGTDGTFRKLNID